MEHITTVSRDKTPAPAMSTLEQQQKAAVFGVYATGVGALATALNTLATALHTFKTPPKT